MLQAGTAPYMTKNPTAFVNLFLWPLNLQQKN